MALTLRTAITAGQTTFDVLGADDLQPGDFKTIDSETVVIRTAKPATLAYGEAAQYRVSVYRGAGGTRAAAHAAAATLAVYSAGGGGAGVTVDNTVDAPFAASTLIAAGATESGADEATLPDPSQMEGEEIVLISTLDRADAEQFVNFEAADGTAYWLKTNGASRQTLTPTGAAMAVQLVDGSLLLTLNPAGFIVHGAAADLIVAERDPDALGFFGAGAVVRPEVPAAPTEQDIVDALVLLGLVSQAAP